MCALVLLIGVFAAFAIMASEMPATIAWPVACAALAWAVLGSRRESRRAPLVLVVAMQDGRSTVNGVAVSGLEIHWRGPLAFVTWQDQTGRTRRLSYWPDVMDPASRRELRLATQVLPATRLPASVAP